ncbi:MAG TPA: hypothetical protein VNJ09_04630 [Chthonomonadales bacterium]|nr:hypothetical protein [Chthonomonadales bacterium]
METSGSKKRNRTLLWIAGGCLGILVCVLVVFLFGFGGLYWLGTQMAEEVEIGWAIPTGLSVGEDFEFRIVVTNVSAAPVEVLQIDFSAGYLRGFLIETTTPPYLDVFEYTPLGGGELFQSYSFRKLLEPGAEFTFAFNGRAIRTGDFSGTVLVCISSAFNCRTNVVRTIVN